MHGRCGRTNTPEPIGHVDGHREVELVRASHNRKAAIARNAIRARDGTTMQGKAFRARGLCDDQRLVVQTIALATEGGVHAPEELAVRLVPPQHPPHVLSWSLCRHRSPVLCVAQGERVARAQLIDVGVNCSVCGGHLVGREDITHHEEAVAGEGRQGRVSVTRESAACARRGWHAQRVPRPPPAAAPFRWRTATEVYVSTGGGEKGIRAREGGRPHRSKKNFSCSESVARPALIRSPRVPARLVAARARRRGTPHSIGRRRRGGEGREFTGKAPECSHE
eukprot:scaffold122763_cov33-Tisochrysis_lutea.AAC.1